MQIFNEFTVARSPVSQKYICLWWLACMIIGHRIKLPGKLYLKIYQAILFLFSGRTIEINTNPDLTL